MGWKNWPYWLKGGVIGALVSVLEIFWFYIDLFMNPNPMEVNPNPFFSHPLSPLSIFFSILLVSIIFALTGLVISKIKKKKPIFMGGLIGLCFFVITLLIDYITTYPTTRGILVLVWNFPSVILQYALTFPFKNFTLTYVTQIIIPWGNFIIGGFIGFIVNWIYEKIKS